MQRAVEREDALAGVGEGFAGAVEDAVVGRDEAVAFGDARGRGEAGSSGDGGGAGGDELAASDGVHGSSFAVSSGVSIFVGLELSESHGAHASTEAGERDHGDVNDEEENERNGDEEMDGARGLAAAEKR